MGVIQTPQHIFLGKKTYYLNNAQHIHNVYKFCIIIKYVLRHKTMHWSLY